jgi:hypothetical protein
MQALMNMHLATSSSSLQIACRLQAALTAAAQRTLASAFAALFARPAKADARVR